VPSVSNIGFYALRLKPRLTYFVRPFPDQKLLVADEILYRIPTRYTYAKNMHDGNIGQQTTMTFRRDAMCEVKSLTSLNGSTR